MVYICGAVNKKRGVTMIYQTINFSMFCDSFRSVRPDNFSYEGLRILYDHILELAEIANSPIELDVIALCCEYT